ncbi:MAG: leucine-rich repeat protein, partial [Clostridia bacterium]|nr:leucine-rich repeat protein [Clostridia bacterium]
LTNDYAMMQYVKNLYTEGEGQSKLEIANDFVIYTENSEKTLVLYYGTETEVVVPLGITIIGTGSIKNPETTKFILPDSVKIIEKDAFYRCQKLELIVFQKGIERIGGNILYSSGRLDVSLDVKFTGTEEEWKAIEKTGWIYYQSYVVMEYEYALNIIFPMA